MQRWPTPSCHSPLTHGSPGVAAGPQAPSTPCALCGSSGFIFHTVFSPHLLYVRCSDTHHHVTVSRGTQCADGVQTCSPRVAGCTVWPRSAGHCPPGCVLSVLCAFHTGTDSPNDTFLRTCSRRQAARGCIRMPVSKNDFYFGDNLPIRANHSQAVFEKQVLVTTCVRPTPPGVTMSQPTRHVGGLWRQRAELPSTLHLQ